MWASNLLIAVLGVSLLVVLAVVLALVAEIIRQAVLGRQDRPIIHSADELAKKRAARDAGTSTSGRSSASTEILHSHYRENERKKSRCLKSR
ncbi:hypothetical protein [Solibaculum mannosilyticum]|uniref:Uncharacterized protein n=1 Tax=Solibaculum mannosilyticum TaxID=2780922 RepID=A0A7I8D1E1_9FIRM|nr:hypothetical protein [Solibaculum mannosilyticum]BCI60617.1 hypothetical protein C12CBH8_12560 [Solibaculum mannosilyticum]